LGSTGKKSAERTGGRTEGWNQALLLALLSPSPLAPCGRMAGGEGPKVCGSSANGSSKKRRLFWGPPKKSPPHCRGEETGFDRPASTFCFSARWARYFAIQSIAEKSCFATSRRVGCCNKLKKCLIVIRVDVAILGLGSSFGASGDYQLTRSARDTAS
jgi:hypothetical protein